MGTRPILQVLKMFQVFFPFPVQVQCERFLLKPYNPFFPVPVPVPVPDQASVNTPLQAKDSEPIIFQYQIPCSLIKQRTMARKDAIVVINTDTYFKIFTSYYRGSFMI